MSTRAGSPELLENIVSSKETRLVSQLEELGSEIGIIDPLALEIVLAEIPNMSDGGKQSLC